MGATDREIIIGTQIGDGLGINVSKRRDLNAAIADATDPRQR
jgi:hypothetical protein